MACDDALTDQDIADISFNVKAVSGWAEGGPADSATMANGRTVPSPSKLIADAKLFKPPIPWTPSTLVTDATQAYIDNDIVYAPVPSLLPFTTGVTFTPTNWYVIQSSGREIVSLDELKADGSIAIGDFVESSEYVTGSGVGAELYEKVSVDPGNPLLNPQATDLNWLKRVDSKNLTPYSFGAIGPVGGVPSDDTTPLNAFFETAQLMPVGTLFDFSGHWGVISTISINQNDLRPYSYACGTIEYIGVGDLDTLLYLEDVRESAFTGALTVLGDGGTTYDTRSVTDLILTEKAGAATFESIRGNASKRHGVSLSGNEGTASHIGIDLGRVYMSNTGAPAYGGGPNVRGKNYDFTNRIDTGSATSTQQLTQLTITGGTDVLYPGAMLRFAGGYCVIDSVDSGAGTIEIFPWLANADTSGTFESSHGAAVFNKGANSASVRIGGLKALGCGAGLSNDCLYGPYVSNLETQVVGVSYGQRGLCRGTVIDVFHPETPAGDVDVLKCDGFISDTTIQGLSVYRGEDVINLQPRDSIGDLSVPTNMIGISMGIDAIAAVTGQKTNSMSRVTSLEVTNSQSSDLVVIGNRTTSTISLRLDESLDRVFGYTTVTLLRLGDSSNATPGDTVLEPTADDIIAGITVMGGASYAIPVMPTGSKILCKYDHPRANWDVFLQTPMISQDSPADPAGGAVIDVEARAAITSLLAALKSGAVLNP